MYSSRCITYGSSVCLGCGLGRGESGCGTPSQFNAECGTINVTRGPKSDAGDTCEWTIEVQDGHIVNVTVSQFHMTDTGKKTVYIDCLQGVFVNC